jgi:hypothetical protein
MDELWTCPRRGWRFTARNTWHSCVRMTVEDHLAPAPELIGPEALQGSG